MTSDSPSASPLALQLAARVEKVDPPTVNAICEAAVLATIALLDDPRSAAGGEWHEAVEAWNGARIRKIVRRGRGAPWQRAQEPAGITIHRDGAEVRAFVPGPLDEAPAALAKLQIQSSPLPEPPSVEELPGFDGLTIVLTPAVEMSWGKRAAQSAHAGQWAWMRGDRSEVAAWDAADRPLRVVQAGPTLWDRCSARAPVRIHDGGFTEIPAGTLTAVAWFDQS